MYYVRYIRRKKGTDAYTTYTPEIEVIFDPESDDRQIIDGKISQEVGEAPTFQFSIPPTHPLAGKLECHVVEYLVQAVWIDDTGEETELFIGFIDEIDRQFNGTYKVYCKHVLSALDFFFLHPYTSTKGDSQEADPESDGYDPNVEYWNVSTPQAFCQRVFSEYSSLRTTINNDQPTFFNDTTGAYPFGYNYFDFQLGYMRYNSLVSGSPVDDPDELLTGVYSNTSYSTCLEALQNEIIEKLGCWIDVYHKPDDYWTFYIAILNEIDELDSNGENVYRYYLSNQTIELGTNLSSYTDMRTTNDFYTHIYPVGGEVLDDDGEGTGLDFTLDQLPKSAGTTTEYGGTLYNKSGIVSTGLSQTVQGVKIMVDTGSEATTEQGLMTYAVNKLKQNQNEEMEINIGSVDLSILGSKYGKPLQISRLLTVNSPYHGIENETFGVTKAEINIVSPDSSSYTVSKTPRSLSKKFANNISLH